MQHHAAEGRLQTVVARLLHEGRGLPDGAALVTERGFDSLDAPIRRVNGLHTPVPYSPALEAAVVPNKDSIAAAIRSLMAE